MIVCACNNSSVAVIIYTCVPFTVIVSKSFKLTSQPTSSLEHLRGGAHPKKKKASRPSVKRRRRFVDVSEATVSTFFLSKVRIDDAAYIEIIDIGLKL
jgi:hypothetical protein